jgi:hypothetical protein
MRGNRLQYFGDCTQQLSRAFVVHMRCMVEVRDNREWLADVIVTAATIGKLAMSDRDPAAIT